MFLLHKALNIKLIAFFKSKLTFINSFSKISFKIFNEGFLIDFIQKKTIQIFFKKSMFYTLYIYNDRFIFERLIFSIIDTNIWFKNKKSLFLIRSPSVCINILLTLTCLMSLIALFF